MQAQKGFESLSMMQSFAKVFKSEGIRGLYRGCIPPLWGSGIYRSIQFSAFEATYIYPTPPRPSQINPHILIYIYLFKRYTVMDNRFGRTQIPFTNGLELRVIGGGMMSGTLRALVETPLEYAKIKRQTGETWRIRDTYTV